MATARKVAYNAAVGATAKVISTGLAIYTLSLAADHLGTDGMGVYILALNFFALFFAIGNFGLYSITTREIAQEGADLKKIMGAVFTLRLLTIGFVFLIVPFVLWYFRDQGELVAAIIVVALTFAFASSYEVLNGIYQKYLIMDRVALTELAGKVIQVGVILFAVSTGKSVVWIVGALLLSMAFNFTVIFTMAWRRVRFVPHIDVAYWKGFLKQSLPMGIAAFLTFLYIKTDVFILNHFHDNSAVGIYGTAYKIVDTLSFFPALIIGLMLPILSRFIFTDKEKFQVAADKTLKVFFLMTVPLIVGVLFMADFIIAIISNESFAASIGVLRIVVFASALIFFGHFFNSILLAGKQQLRLMIVLVGVAFFNIIANIIFIPHFSYMGTALVAVATELLVVGAGAFLAYKYLGYFPHIRPLPGILAAGAGMAVIFVLFAPFSPHILVTATAATLTYGGLLWLFKSVTPEEILSIFARK